MNNIDNPLSVLIIDDEPVVRHMIVSILNRYEYQVQEASNGRDGISYIQNNDVDIVIVDLMMPDISGYEVISFATNYDPDLPIIAVSGLEDVSKIMQAIRTGAWDFLLKPISSMGILNLCLKRNYERSLLRRENREYKENLEIEIKNRTIELEKRTIELENEIVNRKAAEEKLKELNLNLEELVNKRTQELKSTNEELKETLEKLRQDEKSGRSIQFKLLPPEKKVINGYEFSRYLISSTILSGDFLDYFEIDDDNIGFYMADVSGHGVSSAFVTVLLKSFVNQMLANYKTDKDNTILNPGELLSKLNIEVINQDLDKFLTMCYSVINKKTNTMVSANGGQFPFPILISKDKKEYVRKKGYPVGVFDHFTYDEYQIVLPEEFTFIHVSDGIFEVMPFENPDEMHRYLLEKLSDPDIELPDLIKKLELSEFNNPDDITFLRLRKRKF